MPFDKRKYLEAQYQLFEYFALKDQRDYYRYKVKQNRLAAAQVNRIRAFFAFLAGMASALVGLIVATSFTSGPMCATATPTPENGCTALNWFVSGLLIVAVIAPAIGAAFTTLADLYQWDRLITIYDSALENIEVADALSPDAQMEQDDYELALRAYAQGTLSVMNDESAQWGQLIRTPQPLEKFIEEAKQKTSQPPPTPPDDGQ
jgi:hypothetical protein